LAKKTPRFAGGRRQAARQRLVTNSVRYGGDGALRLQIDTDGPRKLRAEVIDQGAGFVPVARDRRRRLGPSPRATLSNRWGVHEGSTHVWFEIER
jgi:anti-sigma regulatory factor (Ser/Thr protein kinase)